MEEEERVRKGDSGNRTGSSVHCYFRFHLNAGPGQKQGMVVRRDGFLDSGFIENQIEHRGSERLWNGTRSL
jgi:hypothetical protein